MNKAIDMMTYEFYKELFSAHTDRTYMIPNIVCMLLNPKLSRVFSVGDAVNLLEDKRWESQYSRFSKAYTENTESIHNILALGWHERNGYVRVDKKELIAACFACWDEQMARPWIRLWPFGIKKKCRDQLPALAAAATCLIRDYHYIDALIWRALLSVKPKLMLSDSNHPYR